MKVFVRTDKEDAWIKYPEYLKYRNMHQARSRSPSLFEPEPEEGGGWSTALALTTGASSVKEPVVVQGAFG